MFLDTFAKYTKQIIVSVGTLIMSLHHNVFAHSRRSSATVNEEKNENWCNWKVLSIFSRIDLYILRHLLSLILLPYAYYSTRIK